MIFTDTCFLTNIAFCWINFQDWNWIFAPCNVFCCPSARCGRGCWRWGDRVVPPSSKLSRQDFKYSICSSPSWVSAAGNKREQSSLLFIIQEVKLALFCILYTFLPDMVMVCIYGNKCPTFPFINLIFHSFICILFYSELRTKYDMAARLWSECIRHGLKKCHNSKSL